MCLSVPAKILEVEGLKARADMGGNIVHVDLSLLPDAKAGEYVLVHAGFVLERYETQDAEQILGYFREMSKLQEDDGKAGPG